ncbi:MAG TPA: hypothetical protein VJP45_13725 [Candidatus Limnocylindria bacterium]|nr:hypothetical protein [Candidatus Limnocylindria bacterium]
METTRRTEDLLEVVRVLLLVQGAVLIATTMEALVWSIAFPGASGITLVLSAAIAALLLVGRARLRSDDGKGRRLVQVAEAALVVQIAIDTALAVGITGSVPPPMALLTRFLIPLAVIALLRRCGQAVVARTRIAVEVTP